MLGRFTAVWDAAVLFVAPNITGLKTHAPDPLRRSLPYILAGLLPLPVIGGAGEPPPKLALADLKFPLSRSRSVIPSLDTPIEALEQSVGIKLVP